jgi:hypothetical protein
MLGNASAGFSTPSTYSTAGRGGALAGAERERLAQRAVQADVVAEERVGPEGDVVDADELGAVLEVLHERLDRVRGFAGDRRVRRGLDADHAALLGAGADDLVGLEARRVPQRAGAGVGDEDRVLADASIVSSEVASFAWLMSMAMPSWFMRRRRGGRRR